LWGFVGFEDIKIIAKQLRNNSNTFNWVDCFEKPAASKKAKIG